MRDPLQRLCGDHRAHLIIGVPIGLVALTIFGTAWAPLVAAVVIGFGKELVYDKLLGRGTPEWIDALCTSAGGAAVAVAYAILRAL